MVWTQLDDKKMVGDENLKGKPPWVLVVALQTGRKVLTTRGHDQRGRVIVRQGGGCLKGEASVFQQRHGGGLQCLAQTRQAVPGQKERRVKEGSQNGGVSRNGLGGGANELVDRASPKISKLEGKAKKSAGN